MKLSDNSIDRLRININRLIERNQKLEKENHRLADKTQTLQKQITELEQELRQTQQKLHAMSTSTSLIEVSGGTKLARRRIESLLREVDKCIALVNK